MELTVKLHVQDFPQGFDHFVRTLALQVSEHLKSHIDSMLAAPMNALPAPMKEMSEEAVITLAKQVAFRMQEQSMMTQVRRDNDPMRADSTAAQTYVAPAILPTDPAGHVVHPPVPGPGPVHDATQAVKDQTIASHEKTDTLSRKAHSDNPNDLREVHGPSAAAPGASIPVPSDMPQPSDPDYLYDYEESTIIPSDSPFIKADQSMPKKPIA